MDQFTKGRRRAAARLPSTGPISLPLTARLVPRRAKGQGRAPSIVLEYRRHLETCRALVALPSVPHPPPREPPATPDPPPPLELLEDRVTPAGYFLTGVG